MISGDLGTNPEPPANGCNGRGEDYQGIFVGLISPTVLLSKWPEALSAHSLVKLAQLSGVFGSLGS